MVETEITTAKQTVPQSAYVKHSHMRFSS